MAGPAGFEPDRASLPERYTLRDVDDEKLIYCRESPNIVASVQAGLTLGNLNALAMEPVGHIAGIAASVIGALSTVLAACLACGGGGEGEGIRPRPRL